VDDSRPVRIDIGSDDLSFGVDIPPTYTKSLVDWWGSLLQRNEASRDRERGVLEFHWRRGALCKDREGRFRVGGGERAHYYPRTREDCPGCGASCVYVTLRDVGEIIWRCKLCDATTSYCFDFPG